MPAAETARLLSTLEMQDRGFSRTVDTANRKLSGLESGMGRASKGTGAFTSTMGRAGKAVQGTQARIGKLVSGPLGLVGLGLGAAGVTKFFNDAISGAEEFGAQSADLAKVLGTTAADASQLVDVLDKYGISGGAASKVLGMQQKNLEKLAGTQKAATKFQKEYGLSLTDNRGRIVGTNELLLRAAAFWNGNATATQKATALSKIYGRQWMALIPLLSQGPAGVNKELREAMRLTPVQIRQLAQLRKEQRELNDTWGDTQVMIGLALVPQITNLAKGLNAFISAHQSDIINLFKGIAQFAEEAGGALQQYVVPGLAAIANAWNSIPADLRKLLIAGVAVNKIGGMVFGRSPLSLLMGGGKGLLGGLRGSSPASPMYTKEVGLAGGLAGAAGGVAGAPGRGTRVLDLLGLGLSRHPLDLLTGAMTAALVAEMADTFRAPIMDIGTELHNLLPDMLKAPGDWFRQTVGGPNDWQWPLGNKGAPDWATFSGAAAPTGKVSTLTSFMRDNRGYTGFEGRGPQYRAPGGVSLAEANKRLAQAIAGLDREHKEFASLRVDLRTAVAQRLPGRAGEAATGLAAAVRRGLGNVATTKDVLAQLRRARQVALSAGDRGALRQIDRAIKTVGNKLRTREWIAAQEKTAREVAASKRSTAEKLRQLYAIQNTLIAHGDARAAQIVGTLINGFANVVGAVSRIPHAPVFFGTAPSQGRGTGPEGRAPVSYVDKGGIIHRKGAAPVGGGGRAAGGYVWPGSWLVGEQGPERLSISPQGVGYVTPLRGSTRGGGLSLRVNVQPSRRDAASADIKHRRLGLSPAENGA